MAGTIRHSRPCPALCLALVRRLRHPSRLGRLAGDANSKAVFVAAGSKIDGGTGVDSFDDELGLFEGLVLGTGIVGWTDPTP